MTAVKILERAPSAATKPWLIPQREAYLKEFARLTKLKRVQIVQTTRGIKFL